MAGEQGYNARVMPQAAAAMPLARPETYGAGLAGAVDQVANEQHQREIRAYQLDRRETADREAADFAHKFALQRQNMDGVLEQLRTNPTKPDYGEHVELTMKTLDAAREGLLSGITNDDVRRRASEQLDGYATQLHGSETTFVAGQRVAKTFVDAKQTMALGANRARQSSSPDSFKQELGAWYNFADSLGNLTPAQKEALRLEGEQTISTSFANGMIDKDPRAAQALIDAGAFNTFLKPQQIDALRNGAQVEVRRKDAEVERAATLAASQAREHIATLQEKASQGIDVAADLPDAMAAAAAMGDASTVEKLKGLSRDSEYARVYGAQTPTQREHRLAALQAMPAEKRSENDQTELKWLIDHKGALDGRFNNDPVGFALTSAPAGMGPPPIENWTAEELAARARWVSGARDAYGSMPPLSSVEARAIGQRASAGDAGYNEALSTLSQFPGRMAGDAARQVFPSDPYAQQLVVLPERYRKLALDGRAAVKANPKLRSIADAGDKDEVAALHSSFHRALGAVPSAQRGAILEVANNIAARELEKNGAVGGELNAEIYGHALDMALGARGTGAAKRGGLGSWAGKSFLMPDGMTQTEFGNNLGTWIRRHPAQAPVNPDGSPIEIRKSLPVAQGGGRYRLYVGDRIVMNRDGKPFEYRAVAP